MLPATLALLLAAVAPLAHAETVLGVYIFSRHGDRTAKSTPPTNLTDLGYAAVFTSGTYFRNRYVASTASSPIAGIAGARVALAQLAVSAPLDAVLMSSAVGFVQGLYPPVGAALGSAALRNGSAVPAPLGGYQIVPIQQTTSGTGSEDAAWLQGSSNCKNALASSNAYFESAEFTALQQSTQGFYDGLAPMINLTFNLSETSFKNAYTIFDLLNVASIHNATFPASSLLTNDTFFQVRTLADNHEYNLAYNASDPIRAIAGATLAAQVVQGLNATITSKGKTKLNVQFGAYNSFQSLFGLANLTMLGPDWIGIPDYASTVTFELVTNATSIDPFPAVDDLSVRFLWHNGTTNASSTPTAYTLFGQANTVLSWNDFVSGMNKFAIGDQQSWCTACGNTTGVCASTASGSSSSSAQADDGSSGGMSLPVAGVIGAMVTLAVILGIEALVLLLAGLRVVKKKSEAAAGNGHGIAKAER